MKYVYIGLIVAFTALILLFKMQDLHSATVSLFSISFTLPVSLLLIAVYVLGMLTGSFVLTLLRGWISAARRSG